MSASKAMLAKIARSHGGRLLDGAIGKALDKALPEAKAAKPSLTKNLLGSALGAVAVRVATRSVPGAIVVGGALVAKHLHERRRARKGPPAASDQT